MQSQKSEGKSTEKKNNIEVSSPACHLTNTPKYARNESPGQLLRHRRRPQKLLDNDQSVIYSTDYCTSIVREVDSQPSSIKFKYPRVNTTYPQIPPINKIQPEDPLKKMTYPPPSLKSPVFLKCNSKKENLLEEEFKNNLKKPTDLDIQFQQMKYENLSTVTEENLNKSIDKGSSQSLAEYCNFDEKKVVKVAPHIRRKDVICDTVDVWSRRSDSSLRPRYRPLIFGGTFPIDAPFDTDAISERDEKLLTRKKTPKTFDIDLPTSL